jgi:hypothetical protein
MFLKKVVNIVEYAVTELSKPEGFVKGDDFENYLRANVFPKEDYDLLHRTASYHGNKGDYIEASLEPDFTFRNRETGEVFKVEAKYRSGKYQGKVEWCKPNQLKRYQQIDRESGPVLLALGVGGSPSSPDNVYLIPICEAKYTGFYDGFLEKYSVRKVS